MQVMEHIASHGMAVVVPWQLTAPLNPEDKVPIFASVMDWAEGHLESKLHHKGVNEDVHLDLDNLVGAYGTHEFFFSYNLRLLISDLRHPSEYN